MRQQNIITIAVFAMVVLLFSCKKDVVKTPQFEVSLKPGTYKAGESITFNISGNPDIITFYSGEQGSKYDNKERSVLSGKPLLQFSTFAQNSGTQENSLKIMASSDFNGTYSAAGIAGATWNDLTSKAVLSSGADNVASGLIDLTGIIEDNKPVYLAFKKRDEKSATLKPRGWTIRSFNLGYQNDADQITYSVADLSTAGWTAVDVLNSTYKWAISTTALTIGGGAINSSENEDWVITKVLYPNAIRPDPGIAVKGVDGRIDTYNFTFKTSGTYKAVFVGANLNYDARKSVIKELTVVVN